MAEILLVPGLWNSDPEHWQSWWRCGPRASRWSKSSGAP